MTEDRGYRWKSIGSRIKEARLKAGLTQRRVSELAGVSPHAVWSWESGKMKPTPEHLLELAYQCETSTDWLLGRDVVEAEILKEADVLLPQRHRGLADGGPGVDHGVHPLRAGAATQEGPG